jgi:REP element-mobilizing transposase RayT
MQMHLEPLSSLQWAYQLHYYLCFRKHRRRPSLGSETQKKFFDATLGEIADRHEYHLLQTRAYPDHVRCLVSLRATQSIADVIKTIKVNFAREYNIQFATGPPFWARGYLALSIGRVRLGAVRQYLSQQSAHHGYDKRKKPPTFRFGAQSPITRERSSFYL